MRSLDLVFSRLEGSSFRRRFRLGEKERAYLESRGLPTVLDHAADFVAKRLAPAEPLNDGKQTPMRGHPVFIAQHATATCCRSCLAKWHGISAGRPLGVEEQRHVVAAIARWLEAQERLRRGRAASPQIAALRRLRYPCPARHPLREVEMDHGEFSGEPSTIWLTENNSPDRKMQLIEEFRFVRGVDEWIAKKGATIDGASIPQPLWALVGSPYTGDYRRASIVHDIACDEAGSDPEKRRAADRMFYHACRAGHCTVPQAILLYVGVRFGAWWNERRGFNDAPRVMLDDGDEAERLRDAYRDVGAQVLDQGEVDDPEVIEKRTDAAMVMRLGVAD